jgi:CAAX protease family protein
LRRSAPWAPAGAHSALNAWGRLPVLFLAAGFDTALGGIIVSMTGWIVMAAVIGVLALTKQLPVRLPEEQPAGVAAGA